MPGGRRWLTRANALSALRLGCAPTLVLALLAGAPLLAGACFWLAVATDFADGPVARRYGESSPLGGRVDHAVDAIFVSCGAAALAWTDALPAVLPPLIALAFFQYAFDSPGGALRASALGRWNGIGYYVALGIPVTRDLLGLAWPGPTLVALVGWLLALSTLVSIADRAVARLTSLRRARGWRGAGRADRSPR